ncbi:MAG TPA: SET domain-containing protein [Pyrinomonadaceae bacterium]|nr:SET domain-containing protein [Pyrinomonadaceae bacterium]
MWDMSKGNQSLVVKRTKTGLGLITLRAIPRGEKIIEYVGPVITTEEANRKGGMYLFELDKDHAIDGSARSNIARYINHSCRPNAKGYTTGRRIWIWSLRAIKPGEEITINYGKEYIDEHIKQCKCAECHAGPGKSQGRKRAAKRRDEG